MPFSCTVPDEKLLVVPVTVPPNPEAPAVVPAARTTAARTATDPSTLQALVGATRRAIGYVLAFEVRPPAPRGRAGGRRRAAAGYWLMAQVNGSVAVSPWSALVAEESSWTETV